MLMYALIGLSLVLVGIAGLQFSYLFYADRLDRERRQHLIKLEHRCAALRSDLAAAQQKVVEQESLIRSLAPDLVLDDEVWVDLIEER